MSFVDAKVIWCGKQIGWCVEGRMSGLIICYPDNLLSGLIICYPVVPLTSSPGSDIMKVKMWKWKWKDERINNLLSGRAAHLVARIGSVTFWNCRDGEENSSWKILFSLFWGENCRYFNYLISALHYWVLFTILGIFNESFHWQLVSIRLCAPGLGIFVSVHVFYQKKSNKTHFIELLALS